MKKMPEYSQNHNNSKLFRFFKTKPIEKLGFIISVIAAVLAYNANTISKEAKDLAARTYLNVTPELIPTDTEPILSVSRAYNISVDGPKFIAVFGMDNKLSIILWISVENTGSIEALDVKLQVYLDFIKDRNHDDPILPVLEEFELGDIAPGKNVNQDVFIAIDNPSGEFPAKEIQRWFDNDLVKARLNLKTTYKNYKGDIVQSGSFEGITRNAGSLIGKTKNVEKSITDVKNEINQKKLKME